MREGKDAFWAQRANRLHTITTRAGKQKLKETKRTMNHTDKREVNLQTDPVIIRVPSGQISIISVH